MPQAISRVGFLVGYAALQTLANADSAMSVEARVIHDAARDVVGAAERSQALFGGKSDAISQLHALANESDTDGRPLDPVAVLMAESFLRALPDGRALPEFASEPDGSVSLDWIESRTRLLTVSVGPSYRVAFAWIDGSDKGHGVARFDGQTIPARILEGIKATENNGHASFRTA